MKAVFVALSLCVVLASAGIFKEEEYQLLFSKWMTQHNKKFSHENFFYRYTVFKNNLDFVVNHNKKNLSYTVGMNAFGDQTTEEFAAARNGFKNVQRPFLRSRNGPHLTHSNIPAAIDWRTKNAVTAVKDQGQCGSCWAFSTTGSTEGAVAIASKKLISLSEQQLMDCSSAQGNQGCNGGLMDQAFEYIIANKGICSEASYPYLGYDSTCNQCTAVATITGYTDVASGDENALQAAAAIGPVSIAIEADQSSFQFYQSGIFSDPNCGTNLDHGVLVVGYYTSSKSGDTPYWIVKNSWGSSWGDNGYIMMIKGQNECGLALQPSYPTGAKAL